MNGVMVQLTLWQASTKKRVCLLPYPNTMFPLLYFALGQVILSLEGELIYLVDASENFPFIFSVLVELVSTGRANQTNLPWHKAERQESLTQEHREI